MEERDLVCFRDIANVRQTCKVCDAEINPSNTSQKGLLAMLCDKCWQTLDETPDED